MNRKRDAGRCDCAGGSSGGPFGQTCARSFPVGKKSACLRYGYTGDVPVSTDRERPARSRHGGRASTWQPCGSTDAFSVGLRWKTACHTLYSYKKTLPDLPLSGDKRGVDILIAPAAGPAAFPPPRKPGPGVMTGAGGRCSPCLTIRSAQEGRAGSADPVNGTALSASAGRRPQGVICRCQQRLPAGLAFIGGRRGFPGREPAVFTSPWQRQTLAIVTVVGVQCRKNGGG